MSLIPDPACTCGHPRSEHAYVVVDGPCGALPDGCQKYDHDCLRDRVPGEQHCIVCHEQGHVYAEHFGSFWREPRIDPFPIRSTLPLHVAATPVHQTGVEE